MNNLYHWQDERMVDLEMREVRRELANANLLREAGLAGSGWLTRAVHAVVKRLKTIGRDRSEDRSPERGSYRPSEKAVE